MLATLLTTLAFLSTLFAFILQVKWEKEPLAVKENIKLKASNDAEARRTKVSGINFIVTARIRSFREGNVFSCVYLSVILSVHRKEGPMQ